MAELICLLDGHEVGHLLRVNGKLSFRYAAQWRGAEGSYPVSLSMPLSGASYPHSIVEPFLWGLLPDNEMVIQRWAARLQVSPSNVFGLLAHVGEDCAGAIQFVTPERLSFILDQKAASVQWIDEPEIEERLSRLLEDGSSGRTMQDRGQFSLSGAQPKTALLYDGVRWGIPSGRTPTTHILKPVTKDFDGHAQNEHFCLNIARAIGLPTAKTEVRQFGAVTAIVVERYDRVRQKTISHNAMPPIRRVHQEDMCQALGVHPARKYQNEKGPSAKQIIELLRANVISQTPNAALTDVQTFVSALVFNWLIGGTDAHAKNYSLLLGGNGFARLAPLYDIASIFAYPWIDATKAKLAMKIGREYEIRKIGTRQWEEFAKSVKISEEVILETIALQATALQEAVEAEYQSAKMAGLDHVCLEVLRRALHMRLTQIVSDF